MVAENERVRQEPKPRGNKMAESHVISALVEKRAEIAGKIIAYREDIELMEAALKHIDGSIKVFSPDYDLRTIPSKRTYKKNENFKHGEFQRLMLQIIRESPTPLSGREITEKIIRLKSLEETTANIIQIQKNTIKILRYQEGKMVKQVKKDSDGVMKWVVA